MKKPILVVLSAGMGSRFGGLKQITPVSNDGNVIIDYSIYDAKKAGFEKVIFIIKEEIEQDFKEIVGSRIEKIMQVEYAYQQLDKIPKGFTLPSSRKKPLGTSHAILCAKDKIDVPFAVINADDYYGYEGFEKIFKFLSQMPENSKDYAMVGYKIENTVTENGSVTRGICKSSNNILTEIVETKNIEKFGNSARYLKDENYENIEKGTIVSMNFWGYNQNFIDLLESGLEDFLEKGLSSNADTCEYLLPVSTDELIAKKEISVTVLESTDEWYGITYKDDHKTVKQALEKMHKDGKYPTPLW